MKTRGGGWEILKDEGTALTAIRRGFPWDVKRFAGACAKRVRNSQHAKPTRASH